jgi:pseudouridine synthase
MKGKSEKLQKVLARAGITSRRKAEEIIKEGRVKVDGKVATLGQRVDTSTDLIEVNGKPIVLPAENVYIMLNKPKGYVCTLEDEIGRKNVISLVQEVIKKRKVRLFPVGRLDMDTEGLLLLTNDGELSYRLTHPSFQVPREYLVRVRGHPGKKAVSEVEKGVELEEGKTQPCKVEILKREERSTLLRMVMYEGRKREIKRMWKKVGFKVVFLKRVGFGPLKLGNLRKGRWRYLSPQEVEALRGVVQLDGRS